MRGFTLIEVLVALAIVAIGMAAVLGTLTSSANTVVYLRDKTFANWVALNQIAQLRLSGAAARGRQQRRRGRLRRPQLALAPGGQHDAGPGHGAHRRQRAPERRQGRDRGQRLVLRPQAASGAMRSALPRGDLPDWGAQLLAPGSAGGNQATTPNGGMTRGPTAL